MHAKVAHVLARVGASDGTERQLVEPRFPVLVRVPVLPSSHRALPGNVRLSRGPQRTPRALPEPLKQPLRLTDLERDVLARERVRVRVRRALELQRHEGVVERLDDGGGVGGAGRGEDQGEGGRGGGGEGEEGLEDGVRGGGGGGGGVRQGGGVGVEPQGRPSGDDGLIRGGEPTGEVGECGAGSLRRPCFGHGALVVESKTGSRGRGTPL